jgi:hypothetical protein
MLVTLVAILCNAQSLCLEKVVTDSNQSDISMTSCASTSQAAVADWLTRSPYFDWRVSGIKCVIGPYHPKKDI